MKAAIFVCGMYRDFDIAVKSWEFLNDLDCDVYFSTWETSKQTNLKLNIVADYLITEDSVKKYIPNAIIEIQSENQYNNLSNGEKWIHHWKTCLKMMKKTKKEYDIIIITRPDNYIEIYNPYKNLFTYNKQNTIYILDNIQYVDNKPFIQDIFFIGNFFEMTKLIDTIPSDSKSMHHDIVIHALSMGYEIGKIENISVVTVRANVRNMNINELNAAKIFEKTIEWGDNQEQYKI